MKKLINNEKHKTMKNFIFITALTFIFFSCNSSSNKKSNTTNEAVNTEETTATVEIDSLLANPNIYLNKTITITGLVVHTCKHSGKKMFLIGTDKDSPVKVIAGNNITLFEQTLEGETVIATGKIRLMEENGEKHEDHKEEGDHKNHADETTSKDSTNGGCAAETNIKKYEMACDEFSIVKE